MAVNDTVRGLKGTITKLKEENAVLEASLEVANGAAAQFQEDNARLEASEAAATALHEAAQQEICTLQDRIARLAEEAHDLESDRNNVARQLAATVRETERADSAAQAHKARAEQLEKELERSRALELDAVTRLRASEAERNRLNGYIQRVAEDDIAREGHVDVADSRSVPRRPSPPLSLGPDYGATYAGAGSNEVGIDLSRGFRRY